MMKLKLQYFGHLMQTTDSMEKSLMLGKTEGRRRRGCQRMRSGWHHQCNGHELGQASGDGEGQEGLACYSLWYRQESDTTGQLNNKPCPSCKKKCHPNIILYTCLFVSNLKCKVFRQCSLYHKYLLVDLIFTYF